MSEAEVLAAVQEMAADFDAPITRERLERYLAAAAGFTAAAVRRALDVHLLSGGRGMPGPGELRAVLNRVQADDFFAAIRAEVPEAIAHDRDIICADARGVGAFYRYFGSPQGLEDHIWASEVREGEAWRWAYAEVEPRAGLPGHVIRVREWADDERPILIGEAGEWARLYAERRERILAKRRRPELTPEQEAEGERIFQMVAEKMAKIAGV